MLLLLDIDFLLMCIYLNCRLKVAKFELTFYFSVLYFLHSAKSMGKNPQYIFTVNTHSE